MEERLAAVALIALRLHLVFCGTLLVAGTLVPFAYEKRDDDEFSINLLTIFGEFDGSGGGEEMAPLIGFAGLALCTVAAVVIVLMQWNGELSPVASRVGKVVGWLMVVGALVPTVLGLSTVEGSRGGPGFGMAFYYPGAILFLYLMYSRTLDRLRTD